MAVVPRRELPKWTGHGLASVALDSVPGGLRPGEACASGDPLETTMPYESGSLEPVIDAQTMAPHHNRHHNAYVEALNNALNDYHDRQRASLGDLLAILDAVPVPIRTVARKNGVGYMNHSMF